MKNSDLPKEVHEGNRWSGRFIPTLLQYLGTRIDPWVWTDRYAIATLQHIWDVVYGDSIPSTIVLNDAAYQLVRCLSIITH